MTAIPARSRASAEEVDYLCRAVSENFARPVTVADVVWSYSGVRPLYDDGASEAKAATRDYVLEIDAPAGAAPVISIFGGKITTYRRLAEEVLRHVEPRAAAARRRTRAGPPRRRCRAAISRSTASRCSRETSAAPIPSSRPRDADPARPRLRHARAPRAWLGATSGGSRDAVRRHADRGGGALSRRAGMGADRRGRRLAPLEARPAHDAGRGPRARRLDEGQRLDRLRRPPSRSVA